MCDGSASRPSWWPGWWRLSPGSAASSGQCCSQLPPNLKADPGALDEVLRQFTEQSAVVDHAGGRLRVCVEFRHESWWTEPVRELLREHDAATCWSDRRGRPAGPLWQTASWGYLRLHEGAAHPWPHYGRQALRTWLHRIADTWPPESDVFAYFNNDQNAAAPADAAALAALADRAGWPAATPAAPSSRRNSSAAPWACGRSVQPSAAGRQGRASRAPADAGRGSGRNRGQRQPSPGP